MKLLAVMRCGHIREIRGTSIAGVACHECDRTGNKVIDIATREWKVTCQSCPYARWCGMSSIVANGHANGHVRNNRGHHVVVDRVVNQSALRAKARLIRIGVLTP